MQGQLVKSLSLMLEIVNVTLPLCHVNVLWPVLWSLLVERAHTESEID